ncbi:glutaminyl-peptide cyclotransferase [Daejeonella lutea]|uniref:Glutamine cyclotransferase n=1 Tax=Daejeonella lutea TaxID=572036 RepID=A0A1T5D1V7_9SPHI|nr:glutaminyl-peptide cyclotransferase [Daejeonella lutea]SKB65659.1 Glutamine cyclotransferase [Daejeonella lutea]
MRLKLIYVSLSAVLLLSRCVDDDKKTSDTSRFISPEAGKNINIGDTVNLQVQLTDKADSVVYFADGERLSHSADEKPVSVPTAKLQLGTKAITAKIYRNGSEPEEITTSIVLKSSLVPQRLTYSVVQEFKHDIESYTQGLEFHNGFFYESDGLAGESSIRKVEPSTGKVLQVTPVHDLFAEGMTIVGDKILMLTYTENQLLEYDLNTLKLIRQWTPNYNRQGWGLCNDGNKIYNSDGSNVIHILNKDTYQEEGYIEVYDNNGPVDSLNELEFIDGMIYANIYESNRIVVINPANGQVIADIDLSTLYPDPSRDLDLVLNGIAWDAQGKRLFVTGKKWDKLFQIKLSPLTAL